MARSGLHNRAISRSPNHPLELVAIQCIADDSAADHGHKRCDSPPHALSSQALCVTDIPASQDTNRAQRSPCGRVHLARLVGSLVIATVATAKNISSNHGVRFGRMSFASLQNTTMAVQLIAAVFALTVRPIVEEGTFAAATLRENAE